MSDVQVFDFKPVAHQLRTVAHDGEIWFVANDVCAALGLDNVSRACSRLDDDEKGITKVNTLGGSQDMLAVNESGLYNLIFTSNKPEAKAFRKWVTSEVLPSIRKTGIYAGKPPATEQEMMDKILKYLSSRQKTRRDICNNLKGVKPFVMAGASQTINAMVNKMLSDGVLKETDNGEKQILLLGIY